MLGGIDLSPYPIDGPLPDLPPSTTGSRGHYDSARREGAQRENLTIRQLGAVVAGARGKNAIHGSAEEGRRLHGGVVRRRLRRLLRHAALYPRRARRFLQLVIPELQRRGLFRTEYEGTTLRENLGLPRPESRYRQ